MEFDLSEEQWALQRALRGMLADTGTLEAIVRRANPEDGRGPSLWHQLSREMGLVGLTVGGDDGPIGTHVDVAVVARELGRVLYDGPYISTVLTAACLDGSSGGDMPVVAEVVGRIVENEGVGAVAGLGWFEDCKIHATPDPNGDTWLIDGADDLVLGGMCAEVLVVFAETDGCMCLFLVEGVEDTKRALRPHIDGNRELASVEFVRARALLVDADAMGLRDYLRELASMYLAAEQVGAAERCLELMVEHAGQRVQFGQPVGAFQAVKHICAQAALSVESVDSEVLYSAYSLDERSEATPTVVHMAKAAASDAAFEVACSLIQVLGGIGFTWEHSAHHYFRRAVSSRQLFGTAAQHRDLVATALFDGIRP